MKEFLSRVKRKLNKESLVKKKEQVDFIYRYAKPHIFSVVVYMLLGLAGTVFSLFSSLVSRDLVDIITGHNTGALLEAFALMIGSTLGGTIIGLISNYLSSMISIKVDNEIKGELFEDMMSIEWEALSKFHSGELVARWSTDASRISSGILNLVPNFVICLFRFGSALYMVIKYDASFAIFAIAGIPISLIISRESMKRMQKSNMGSMAVSTKMSSFNQETFSNVQMVKAFDMLSMYTKRLHLIQEEYKNVQQRYQKSAMINSFILTIVSMLVAYSAEGWGIYKVWSGAITYGTMTMFLALSSTLSGTVNALISLVPNAIGTLNSANRIMKITALPHEDDSNREMVKDFMKEHYNDGVGLAISDITYAYPDGENVFEHVSIMAKPHEIVALVGPSGEGKTTMLRFILSIICAQQGRGYVFAGDEIPENIEDAISLSASTRQLFAYVPQGNTMFSGTIAENLRNVKEDATDEEIIEALKMACAWKFVNKLPDGINSEIKERGGGFSEGQSQRLSIARALLRRSPILLLDEATSALDMATEKEVLKNIMKDDYPRTCIVTTHRPSVLNSCDRVYSISNFGCRLMTPEEVQEYMEM